MDVTEMGVFSGLYTCLASNKTVAPGPKLLRMRYNVLKINLALDTGKCHNHYSVCFFLITVVQEL